jgi:hypothetical protein
MIGCRMCCAERFTDPHPIPGLRKVCMLASILILSALAASSAAAHPALRIEVAYREPADAFEILDNVSEWWPGYTDPAYREAWADSVGVVPADTTFFARYARLRSRYFDRSGQQDEDPRTSRSGLFTDRAALTADPVAFAFYGSETMEEAFGRLGDVVEPDEVVFLRSFYAHFSVRLARLKGGTERSVAASLERTGQTLGDPGVVSYLDGIVRFFGVGDGATFTALYVWWPDAERVVANPNGPYLLMRVRPHPGEALDSADVVVHEAVHVISALQPDAQKRSLSDAILAACPDALELTRRLGVVEEPLATVLGNMEFRRRFEPARFKWGRQWYGEPWVDLSARLLYPVVMDALARGQTVSGTFTADAAALCAVGVEALEARRAPNP